LALALPVAIPRFPLTELRRMVVREFTLEPAAAGRLWQ
jgi:hypothetical protein